MKAIGTLTTLLLLWVSPALGQPRDILNKLWAAAGLSGSPPALIEDRSETRIISVRPDGLHVEPKILTEDRDALALLFGHEIAHVILGHKPSFNAAVRAKQELAADFMGFALALKAGFNRERMLNFYSRMSLRYDASVYCPFTARRALLEHTK